jgi:hypothetical protein
MEKMMIGRTVLVFFLSIFAVPGAMAIEEPEFEILLATPDYEVRRYAPYLVAEVDVHGDFDEAGDEAFRILAAYIFGENESAEKMEMTAPVESRSAKQGIRMAMTAPVTSSASDAESDTYTYGFVMESKYTVATIPKPKDSRVRLRVQEPKTVAVKRYSGRWTEENYRRNESGLMAALEADDLEPRSEPILARYNSPFTPWFLRRNEVMIEVEWRQ